MAQYCHASHEVYHDEGVAQRAHNLSPVPFGAAKRAKESSYHCSDTASQMGQGRKGASPDLEAPRLSPALTWRRASPTLELHWKKRKTIEKALICASAIREPR